MASNFKGPVNSSDGFVGNLTGNVAGNLVGNVTGQVSGGDVTTYGALTPAIALTNGLALLDGEDNAVAATLAAGAKGQVIRVKAIDVTNAVTLTPAAFIDGTTITFTPANEYVVLMSDGTSWYLVGGNAAVT